MSDLPPELQEILDRSSDRERAWLEHYLACMNATEAAKLAGWKAERRASLTQMGWQTRKKFLPIIEHRLAEVALSTNEILARLAHIARGSLDDFLTPAGRGIRIDLKKAKQAGVIDILKTYSKGRHGTRIELYSALEALNTLAKIGGLFRDEIRHSGSVDVVEMTLEQWLARQKAAQNQVNETLEIFEDEEGEDE